MRWVLSRKDSCRHSELFIEDRAGKEKKEDPYEFFI
jgi:hypothetical protein